MYVHSSFHSSQKVDATQLSIDEWVDEQNVSVYSETLSPLKGKEIDMFYHVGEPWRLAKWNKPQED